MLTKQFYANLFICLLLVSNLFAASAEKINFAPAKTFGNESSIIFSTMEIEEIILSEGFEGDVTGWSYINADGDDNYWGVYSGQGHTGTYAAGVSYSTSGNDDWFLTPQIVTTSGESITYSFWARSDDSYSTLEDFNVKLSISGSEASDFSVTLEEVRLASATWTQYTYDLSDYAGESIYLAIQSIAVDKYYLFADDFLVTSESGTTGISADFTAAPLTGTAPLVVQFTDVSTGSPASWSWDFDNNSSVDSEDQNPSHTYTEPGTYTVTLLVTNDSDEDTETKTSYIVVNEEVIPGDDPDGWFMQNPYPTPNDLFSIYPLDDNTVISVGAGGLILKTIDNGETWESIASGTNVSFANIHFPTATTGYIVGDSPSYGEPGVVLKTTDAGETWTTLTSNINYDLSDVFFTDVNTGWIIGDASWGDDGSVSKTTDGGLNWIAQSAGIDGELYSVYFNDSNTGWIGGDRYCATTTDGGTTWAPVDVTGEDYNYIDDVQFLDENNGWLAAGYKSLYQTTNGGTSWTQVVPGSEAFKTVHFTDMNNGCASGSLVVYQTTDGGTNWTEQIDLNNYDGVDPLAINCINFYNTSGWLVTFAGKIYNNDDGTWTELSASIINDDIENVYFADENKGWVVGRMDDIWATTDGGNTWFAQTVGANYTLNGIDFVDGNTGWVVGSGTIYSTINGGTNWIQQTSGTTSILCSVDFIDANNGWAVGYQGTILNTSNGGVTWTTQTSNTGSVLYKVFFLDANTGWICGADGTVLKTINGGATWESQTSGITRTLNGIVFLNTNHGFAVSGDYGHILETTNGGTTWTTLSGGSYDDPYYNNIQFVDDLNGWIVGNGGYIYATEDGGTTWEQQLSGVGVDLEAVYFVNPTTGWAVGDNGAIIKTASGGLVGIEYFADNETLIPETIRLKQNFPNPFNPTTTISYALPEQSAVSLTIYDVRGSEITTLQDGIKSAGIYEVQWNGLDQSGNSLSTGVYFCRLQAGSYNKTIKMLYLK